MVVLRGVYGDLRLRVYVKKYVIAYMCLSSSRTHASAAFEVLAVCHHMLFTKIVPSPVQ